MELQDYHFTMNYRGGQRQIILCMDLLFKRGKDSIHFTLHLFMGKRIAVRKKQPTQFNSDSARHFVNKALLHFDLEGWIDKLGIKHFRSIYQIKYTKKNVE